jgi:CPA1 family monovalent cation:H+ antiporter
MDQELLFVALLLMVLIAALSVLAERTRLPSPVIMLLAGSALAFAPGLPQFELPPDVVLLLLLPPLLYSSGVGMSWRGFRSNSRAILMLAVGCVLFTAAAVAAVMHYVLGTTWAVGFVLGAIVSPPDAVAAVALLRTVRLPRRLATVLEGESLVNDATALVTLAFALNAVITGQFSIAAAVGQFIAIVVGEVAYGIFLGWAVLRIRAAIRAPRAEVLVALATPFIAFWLPHALGGSGVIACVATGLYISWNGRRFISPETRLQGYFIWDLVVWATESLVFLLGGLQARQLLSALQHVGWDHALIAGCIITATVIVVRFVWVFPATYLPRRLFPRAYADDPCPSWQSRFFVAFAGLRGVDSLAAALLVPQFIGDQPFPQRDLILFCTFFVIGVTLFGSGVSLPRVVHWLKLDREGHAEAHANSRDERAARVRAMDRVLEFLGGKAHGAHAEKARAVADYYERRRRHYLEQDGPGHAERPMGFAGVHFDALAVERAAIAAAYDENRITDEARRRIERELDIEDARLRNQLRNAATPLEGIEPS